MMTEMNWREAAAARGEIASRIESEINKITGALVDVVVMSDKMMVTTENLEKVEDIKDFMGMVNNVVFFDETFYEEEEDDPAAINLQYNVL